jgi:uncharacterized protein YbjT (DUF2867 family)
MKILLTGVTGYIGKRLLPVLIEEGYTVVCCVRDKNRFNLPNYLKDNIEVLEVDLLNNESLNKIPNDIDGAYYLVHSMATSKDYQQLEAICAKNFSEALNRTNIKHLIYLSGITNDKELSKHLESRKTVEDVLKKGNYNLTTLRSGIIIGSGSASFEIIRDLIEKLPIMITPKWLNTKCQPIGISDVLKLLNMTLFNEKTFNKDYDIGGKDILTYKEMLLQFSELRKLKRSIYTIPVMTPRLSSYWLFFVTSISYNLAVALVNSMKVEIVCRNNSLMNLLGIAPKTYKEALQAAFSKIENNEIVSSWKDAYTSSGINSKNSDHIQVPSFGCFIDKRKMQFENKNQCIDKIWSIGGSTGWYCGDWLWKLRGHIDKLVGGVGLRRGRTNSTSLNVGDALDFWRVLYANKEEGRLLLYAEMKLPGEAWLEFKIESGKLIQQATFRPLGLLGRMYWYSVLPFHEFIFSGMLKKIITSTKN